MTRYEPGKVAEARETVAVSLDDFYGSAGMMPRETLQNMFAGEKHWAAHMAGAFPAAAKHKKITRRTPGANIACYCDLPCDNDVLGTSAAMACATLFGLAAARHLILEPLEIAILAHRLEGQTAGASGGYAEPMTAVLGKKDSLLQMKSQPHELTGYAPPPKGCTFAAIAFGNGKDGAAGLEVLRASVGMAQAMVTRTYRDLGGRKDPSGGYLANVPAALFERYFRRILPEAIDGEAFVRDFGPAAERIHAQGSATYHPHAAAEFQVQEHARARALFEKLQSEKAGDELAVEIGRIMLESLAGQEQLARQFVAGRAAMEADLWRELIMGPARGAAKGFYGVRGAGAWPGEAVAVLMADTAEARTELDVVARDFEVRTGRQAQVLIGSSSGASETTAMRVETSELGG